MINSDDFAKRLERVIEYFSESASSFADSIGVQRSSISHLLSGRNKPSLDFVLKVLSAYPEVELYWLLNGKGEFPSQSKKKVGEKKVQETTPHASTVHSETENKNIDKIVIFYKDGTFEEFQKK